MVDKVFELVTNSYIDVLPGLSRTELPVITISSKNILRPPTMFLLMQYLQQTVPLRRSFDEITSRLEGDDGDDNKMNSMH